MMNQISGALFKQMILHGAAAITAQKQAINDLNVFPVPDGDTGTNMSMTIAAAVTELKKAEPPTVDKAGEGETDVELVLEAAIREGYEALAETTNMNPVLKKAGVVDARGKGYLDILEGMLRALRGEEIPQVE